MRLVFHGGKCCGIKTIYDLEYDPKGTAEAVSKKLNCDDDQFARDSTFGKDFFTSAAPEETLLQRLDRLIEFCEKRRPNGIIEIVLADVNGNPNNSISFNQYRKWAPLIRRRKFRCVSNCYNSNSGNRVYVFHRKSDKE